MIDAKSNDEVVKILEQNPDVVLYFTGKNCGACRSLNPNLPKIVDMYEGLVFVKVDSEICENLIEICNITALPTFVMFRNGVDTKRVIGANPRNIIDGINECYL